MYTALAIGVHFCCMQLGKRQLVTFFFFNCSQVLFQYITYGFLDATGEFKFLFSHCGQWQTAPVSLEKLQIM